MSTSSENGPFGWGIRVFRPIRERHPDEPFSIERKTPRTMLVDDHELGRIALQALFELEGFVCYGTDSSAQALSWLREEGPFDLVMLHPGLPSGALQLIRAIRAGEAEHPLHGTSRMVFIAGVSGAFQEADILRYRQYFGCDAAMCPPLDPEQVLNFVNYVTRGGDAFTTLGHIAST